MGEPVFITHAEGDVVRNPVFDKPKAIPETGILG
jgi:hypothetical protein